MSEAKVTSNVQITIPADIRKTAGIKPRAQVVFTRLRDGTSSALRAKRSPLREVDRQTPRMTC